MILIIKDLYDFVNAFKSTLLPTFTQMKINWNKHSFHTGWITVLLFFTIQPYNLYVILTGQFPLKLKNIFYIITLSYLIAVCQTVCHHRLYSHRSFKTNRVFAFILNYIGSIPLLTDGVFYASLHRAHHIHCETDQDPYGGVKYGFLYNVIGLITNKDIWLMKNIKVAPDLIKLWENKMLFNLYWTPATSFVAMCSYLFGHYGFMFSLLCINSSGFFVSILGNLGHYVGKKNNEELVCEARNASFLFGILSTGESYHANHHDIPWSANLGWYKHQPDVGYAFIKGLECLGLAHSIRHYSPKDKTN